MTVGRVILVLCIAVILGVPLLVRPRTEADIGGGAAGDALTLIVITPHNEQIRYEFARAFDHWHQRNFGRRVNVVYNVPGGTTEIRKMLESQFAAALEDGRAPGGDADLVFGGGSFEHARLRRGVRVKVDGADRDEPISQPVDFTDDWLRETYGDNDVGGEPLYDKDKHWFGLAVSGFGIVFNRDALDSLGLSEPHAWSDLCDPRLRGWVALVNPGQSGSVASAFESILKRAGWVEGWRILRRAAANARYFSASSLKPPLDVALGDAAMGVCIDFYGRFQSQALSEAGDPHRLGYVDPPGGSTIDPDPISMLRGAQHPELAKRFIEFCLSDDGQALWQFPSRSSAELSEENTERANKVGGEGDDAIHQNSNSSHSVSSVISVVNPLGPERYELRRLPIRRSMYDQHADEMIDKVNPFAIATRPAYPDSNFRDFIAPMFTAMAIDNHHALREAWEAIVTHPAYPRDHAGIVTAGDVADTQLKAMLEAFDALPVIDGPNGVKFDLADTRTLGEVRAGWLLGGWAKDNLWNAEQSPVDALRSRFNVFFRAQYEQTLKSRSAQTPK